MTETCLCLELEERNACCGHIPEPSNDVKQRHCNNWRDKRIMQKPNWTTHVCWVLLYSKEGGGDSLFPAEGHSDIYTVVRGTYKISNLEISLIYLVKHVINSFLM